jgi:hypothetical protein
LNMRHLKQCVECERKAQRKCKNSNPGLNSIFSSHSTHSLDKSLVHTGQAGFSLLWLRTAVPAGD